MDYSIVVPIKDEEENISLLVEEIEDVMNHLKVDWELICIDDGSTDGSLKLLKDLCLQKKYMKTIAFTKNFGQSSAFSAGFRQASGRYVITLDADLQNDPKDILKLIAEVENCDMVCGWRASRKDPWNKKIISKLANSIRSRFCQDGVRDTGCSLKIYRREALVKIPLYKGMHRFLPALFLIEGFRIKEVAVAHRPRVRGKTKYRFFNRLLGPIMDMFVVRWMRRRHLKHEIKEIVKHDL